MERKRWPISKRDRLEELCVLAAAGALPPSELARLELHLKECESCRALFTELRDIHAVQLAHVPSLAIHREAEEESRLKDLILRAAQKESADFAEPMDSPIKRRPIRIEMKDEQSAGQMRPSEAKERKVTTRRGGLPALQEGIG